LQTNNNIEPAIYTSNSMHHTVRKTLKLYNGFSNKQCEINNEFDVVKL